MSQPGLSGQRVRFNKVCRDHGQWSPADLPLCRGGINPGRHKMCERPVLSPIAIACRWSLLLLPSPLLSAQPRSSDAKPTRTAGPPGPRTASGVAELRITRVFSCVAYGFKARLILASGSRVAAGGDRWLLMAVWGHLGGTPVMRRPDARWSGTVARPSVFQAGHAPKLPRIVRALCAVAGRCW
jgi:hypothetical protein